jgi:tRNA-splicing ligase RtcB
MKAIKTERFLIKSWCPVPEDEIKRLDGQGIIHGVRNVSDLDEATGAYKDINEVMNNQKDLVEIVVELKPLGVIKG